MCFYPQVAACKAEGQTSDHSQSSKPINALPGAFGIQTIGLGPWW